MASSSVDPSAPPQPPKEAAYTAPSDLNPATHSHPEARRAAEKGAARGRDAGSRFDADTRGPDSEGPDPGASGALPSALGQGVEGGGGPTTGREARETGYVDVSSARNGGGEGERTVQADSVDAEEQMAPLGEGAVADAVERRAGTQRADDARRGGLDGEEDDFAADMDRKKAEQAGAREAVKQARHEGFPVDGRTEGRRRVNYV